MKVWPSAIKQATVCAGVFFAFVTAAGAIELVTEQEAAYPDDPYGDVRGSPTPGPDVELVTPSQLGLIKSPFNLKIKFRAHGGTEIDRDSVAVIYKKLPAIDLTQRMTPFIRGEGIDMKDAELPPGTHRFRIDVKDSRGRWGAPYFFKISVAK
jgi:hypothetical protein